MLPKLLATDMESVISIAAKTYWKTHWKLGVILWPSAQAIRESDVYTPDLPTYPLTGLSIIAIGTIILSGKIG